MIDSIQNSDWFGLIVVLGSTIGLWVSIITLREYYFPSNNKAIERYKRKHQQEKLKRKDYEQEIDILRTILENLGQAAESEPSLKGVLRQARVALSRGNPDLLTSLETEHLKRLKPVNAEHARELSRRYKELAWLEKTQGNTHQAIDHLLIASEYTPNDPSVRCDLGELYYIGSQFKEADKSLSRGIALMQGGQTIGADRLSQIYTCAGNTNAILGELDQAVAMYEKSLRIEIELGRKQGVATNYMNLANVNKTRGELDQALTMYGKALAINTELGHKQDMANNYSNLGVVHETRGELEQAAVKYELSLAINIKLDYKDGMGASYRHLGNIKEKRGELDQAVELYERALTISIAQGHKRGMSVDYANLGNVYSARGEFDRAAELYEKSLTIDSNLGYKTGMSVNYGNLGALNQRRGKLNQAVAMYEKALIINTELNRKVGMATNYSNLALLGMQTGKQKLALEYARIAIALYNDMGMPFPEFLDKMLPANDMSASGHGVSTEWTQ